ncbi:MAG TPA: glycosyltransferase family A protein [Actinocrinis sp.]|uniref:glycosyltransferase family 2 protein n=1 Tax=Actinocrinis sp. TaxID=1920516 RepID=UPI002DDDA562|nr:glycosyltransferase family A protein [Actinocrinis sp.]HEV2342581.1 glycosyltransferase family A protein [Actinocrinis sp.]
MADRYGPASPALRAVPRFSVVIPAVNESLYIGRCLESLAAQDFAGGIEVIVVDNNSIDDTAAIARSMGAIVVSEPEPGVCFARQRGTEIARGEYVVSTDADTTFDPGWLSRIDAQLRRRPQAVAVAGPCRWVACPWWGTPYASVLFGCVNLMFLLTGRVIYASAANIAFRRDAWSGYDTRLTQGGDELDLLRQLRQQGKIVFDIHNWIYTSSRRLRRGLIYSVLVTCLYYYVLAYVLNRVLHRQVLGTAPQFRYAGEDVEPARSPWRNRLAAVGAVIVLVVFVRFASVEGFV